MNQLKHELDNEEAKQIANGQNPPYKVEPAGFFSMAIEIEEQQ